MSHNAGRAGFEDAGRLEAFVARLRDLRSAHPTQVIVGFLHPDGLQVLIPITPELLQPGAEKVAGETLMQVHNDSVEDARTASGK